MSKKKFYKRWWFWILALIVAFGIAGSGDNEAKKVASKDDSTQTKNEEKQDTNKTKVFKVGDTIEIRNFKVTVNKVSVSNGGEFIKPKDNNEFLNVDVTLENISDKPQGVSSMLMFKVVDKEGRSYNQTITENQQGDLDGEVGPGRKMTGEYVVEVPKGSSGLELEFDSSLLTGGQVVVNLN